MLLTYNPSFYQKPHTWIRLVELCFAISAFTVMLSLAAIVEITCPGHHQQPDEFIFEFPFDINEPELCRNAKNESISIEMNASIEAELYVVTGVVAMLYCFFSIFVFAHFEEICGSKTLIPLIDFLVTSIFASFWLAACAAWREGVVELKSALDIENLILNCSNCEVASDGNSYLDATMVLGLINCLLWSVDLWMIFRNFRWFDGDFVEGEPMVA